MKKSFMSVFVLNQLTLAAVVFGAAIVLAAIYLHYPGLIQIRVGIDGLSFLVDGR
jgi:hypothetical protein